jgi:hypothetical protein
MKNVTFSIVYGCALSLALLGIVGCAIDENDPNSASDEVASDTSTEHSDSERAAAIAKAKMALIDTATITPTSEFAACGKKGPTSTSERVNDAAFTGAAQQRSGSSTNCTALGTLQPTHDALYYCFTFGNDGFTWTYNKNISLSNGATGWTRDDLLRGDGSFTYCGF